MFLLKGFWFHPVKGEKSLENSRVVEQKSLGLGGVSVRACRCIMLSA